MKYISDGLVYDTDLSTEIGTADPGAPGTFHACSETLYRTPNGRYFLEGEGGPMSRWRKPAFEGGWTGGRGMRVLSEQDALRWAEQHLSAGDIEAHFGRLLKQA